MDECKLLFDKIKRRDKTSFHVLTDAYGWKLYSYIRRNVDNRELADQIFSETLSKFQTNAEKYECEDPIEAMLCLYADEIGAKRMNAASQDLGKWQIAQENGFSLPEVPAAPKKEKGSIGANIFYGICIFLLIAAILLALWFLVGMLVDMEILPKAWDFGYSWFNENIAYLF